MKEKEEIKRQFDQLKEQHQKDKQKQQQKECIRQRPANQRSINTATKRKGYWENISKRQCRNEIKNKHTRNHIKTKRARRKGEGE